MERDCVKNLLGLRRQFIDSAFVSRGDLVEQLFQVFARATFQTVEHEVEKKDSSARVASGQLDQSA
jgi:hypothetical protein